MMTFRPVCSLTHQKHMTLNFPETVLFIVIIK